MTAEHENEGESQKITGIGHGESLTERTLSSGIMEFKEQERDDYQSHEDIDLRKFQLPKPPIRNGLLCIHIIACMKY
jgi:hypothetical protein